MVMDRLDAAYLERALRDELIGHTVEMHGSVPSTMPLARRLAVDADVGPGAIVIAEEQTAGRGRLTHRWEAPYGQALLMTAVLKPPLLPADPAQLPMLAGLAIAEGIADVAPAYQGRIDLKWPNDVLIGQDVDAMGKVAGILIESAYSGSTIAYALLGIGINVNQDEAVLPPVSAGVLCAASMRMALSCRVDRTALTVALCRRLSQRLSSSIQDDGERLYQDWRQRLTTIGRRVTAHAVDGDRAVSGMAVDADRNGSLVVVDDLKVRHTYGAGDVTLHPRSARSGSS